VPSPLVYLVFYTLQKGGADLKRKGTFMRDHIRLVGILNIVMGGFAAVAGIAIFLVMGTIGAVVTAGIQSSGGSDAQNAAMVGPIIALIATCIAVFFLVLAAPSIIGGLGLLWFKPWSRVFMIVVSAFHLLSVPIGTALGIYGLWVLLNEDARKLLESGGALPLMRSAPPAPAPL
jgi:hypothetical protein